jgi:hypothetical protein
LELRRGNFAMLQTEKHELVRAFFPAVAYCCAIYETHPCRFVRRMKRLEVTAQPYASFSRGVIFQGVIFQAFKGHFGELFSGRVRASKRGQAR